ncbi:hypothetical protein EJ03DRAFT_328607 [Teratosphaeria nubilosa]|uniref:Uncharacterized protein n=1 Tax=Teratosphaeria nubilosa TaxID=161662 RepID=A0A6G1L6J2_9PEZI|nr:hypothetical protein EJ03DRAFT_328607 [Teratosphaeria nubilosa]
MALSCNSGREMAKKDFVDWILANFHFLRSLASNQFVEPTSSGRTATSEKFRQEFHWALQTVHQDLPITVRQPYILGTKMYSISRTTGRRYLIHADILREEHQQGVFRFFDLPPELRSQVHRLIFEYDRPLHFEHTSRGPSNAAHFLQRHSDGSHIVLSKHKHILLG